MTRYHVRHTTVYGYSQPVTLSHHLARLKPRNTPFQTVENSTVSMTPAPAYQTDSTDAFGNTATFMVVETPHTEMTGTSDFTATVKMPDYPDAANTPAWESVASALALPSAPETLDAAQFAHPSCFVPFSQKAKDYAAPSFTPNRPVLEAAEEIMRRIYADFKYDSSATSIATPIDETLEMKRGVCQDFAHVGLACLRAWGLAARYVSGYIRTRRAAEAEKRGEIEMIGGDASHAWFSVFVPTYGWVDLDPTNNMYMQTEHLTVGWGRDFDDMSPIKGLMTGGGSHTVKVDVSVRTA